MTKLAKINEVMGTLEDVYPNLIIISGKNIAIPVDKKHIFENTKATKGDIIHVKYDERGYLLEAELVSKGSGEQPKPKVITEKEKQFSDAMHEKFKEPTKPEPIKEYVSLRERLIVYQTAYKECNATVREMILMPDSVIDESEFNRVMDIALTRAKKDASELIKAAGDA